MEYLKINSISDKLPLDVIVSAPEHPKAIFQIVHGMCEHKERYLDFIEYLNDCGYVVIIHDHRGHGKSVLDETDLGYFYGEGARAIVEDVHQLTNYIKKKYPNLPVCLFGHSMGSLVVRNYIQKYDHEINALIVCGSPSKNKLAGLGKLLCKAIAMVKGDKYHSKLLQKMSFGAFNKGFDKPNEWICSNSQVVDEYNNNPLCTFTFSVNGFYNLLSLMQNTYKNIDYEANKKLPVLFISGKEDPCLINEKAFNNAVTHLKKQGYQHVISILFEHMRHEILNEKYKETVYSTIKTFLVDTMEENDA